uniref:myotubularin-related protein 8-like isoform X1 n=1 Tax=Styela clava TaxID=7725 RepID=UPI00193A0B82|nr:myotubularin-related protein 8-like isoform X1 [Styela clava]
MEFIRIPKVERVKLIDNQAGSSVRRGTDGTLFLTATHLIFVNSERTRETWIVHTHINSVEKLSLSTAGSPLVIRCKTFQVFTFMVAEERDCHDLYNSLLKLSKPMQIKELYAFSYNPRGNEKQNEGWDMFKLDVEFMRMGLPTKYWKTTDINKDFKLCYTYPQLLCVPTAATDSLLHGSAAFRSKGRLPVLSYLHENGAAISRCSQPLSGLNSRSQDDEGYVNLIRISKPNKDDFMYIVDTRPRINAVANRAQGKGYENMDFYDNIKYHFLGIDNIHVMRGSLSKLLEVCSDTRLSMSSFLEGVNSSGWLKHVHNVLQVSRFIANAIGNEGRSVLVHCSDGWDRTAQTCSLAAIMLNPHYRTIEGFLALIQKEWLSFGHKFTHRLGHLEGDPKETSPVFTQFIDAVWQLMRYRPAAFQFNETLLLDLHDHAMSCQFGTFIGNCERERLQYDLANKTHSLWGWMWKRLNLYGNPLYSAAERHQKQNQQLLLPSTCPHAIRFWRGMYNRYDAGLHPRESINEALSAITNENTLLQDTVKLLHKRLEELGLDADKIIEECKQNDANQEEEISTFRNDSTPDTPSSPSPVLIPASARLKPQRPAPPPPVSRQIILSDDMDDNSNTNTDTVKVGIEKNRISGGLTVSFSAKNLIDQDDDGYGLEPNETVKSKNGVKTSDSWEMVKEG